MYRGEDSEDEGFEATSLRPRGGLSESHLGLGYSSDDVEVELRSRGHSDVMTIEETYLNEDEDVEVRDVELFREEASMHRLFVDDAGEDEDGGGGGGELPREGEHTIASSSGPAVGSSVSLVGGTLGSNSPRKFTDHLDPVSRWVANTLSGEEAAVRPLGASDTHPPMLMGVPPAEENNGKGLNGKKGKTVRKGKVHAKKSANKKWLCVDGTGSAELVTLTKADLTQTLGIQLRDLRLLDPMLVTSYPSAILCRERSLVVNLEYVKMIVGLERCYVTNLEDESAQNFVSELKRRLEYQYGARLAKEEKERREREEGVPGTGTSNVTNVSTMQRNNSDGTTRTSGGNDSRAPLMGAGEAPPWAPMPPTQQLRTPDASSSMRGRAPQTIHTQRQASGSSGNFATTRGTLADAAATGNANVTTPVATSKVVAQTTSINNQLEDLPFELRVLEAALDIVLKYMETLTSDLEASAHPALDALTSQVDTENLERVRRVKNRMVRLTTRVETLREVLEKFLDDDADMRDMNLAAKEAREEQERIQDLLKHGSSTHAQTMFDTLGGGGVGSVGAAGAVGPVPETPHSALTYDSDEEEEEAIEVVEQLLEPFFLQADNTWNKLQTLTEYIDDTEDYVNIQLDSQRNQLIRLDLILTCLSASIALITAVTSLFAMNVQLMPGSDDQGPYSWFVIVSTTSCAGAIILFFSVMTYSRYKRLI